MNKKLIIVGLNNYARIAEYYFRTDTAYEIAGFAVDQQFKTRDTFCDKPVYALETLTEHCPPAQYRSFIAVGYSKMNNVREGLYHRLKKMGYELPNYINSKCTFLSQEPIGDNNMILEDNTIQPFVQIGSDNIFWSGNHIGHDVRIGDHNFISSHVVISGFTTVQNNCFLGVNATLRDNITIADKTLIAAGAIVLHDTEAEDVYMAPKSTVNPKTSTKLKI